MKCMKRNWLQIGETMIININDIKSLYNWTNVRHYFFNIIIITNLYEVNSR